MNIITSHFGNLFSSINFWWLDNIITITSFYTHENKNPGLKTSPYRNLETGLKPVLLLLPSYFLSLHDLPVGLMTFLLHWDGCLPVRGLLSWMTSQFARVDLQSSVKLGNIYFWHHLYHHRTNLLGLQSLSLRGRNATALHLKQMANAETKRLFRRIVVVHNLRIKKTLRENGLAYNWIECGSIEAQFYKVITLLLSWPAPAPVPDITSAKYLYLSN